MRSGPRVLLDATAIPANRGGVGRYVENLAAALDAEGARLTVVCRLPDAATFVELAPHARVVPGPPRLDNRAARLAWEQTDLPGLARRIGVDVVHSPHYTMPLVGAVPTVVTVHDATCFSHPYLHEPVKRTFLRTWTRISLRRAAVCVVPSQVTADELVRRAHARRDRLRVSHHGVDTAVFRPPENDEIARLRQCLDLRDQPWVAFLGALEPRKNVPALVGAFADALTGEPPDLAISRRAPALVLAGGAGWDNQVGAALAAVPPRVRVVRAGHLANDLLPALLGGSLVTVYPSLGEGFGLPVLEAMACGAAVLTTRRLAIPEVGGDGVAYTEPDRASIAASLGALLADDARRATLGAAARERAARFTWRNCALAHHQAYESAAGLAA